MEKIRRQLRESRGSGAGTRASGNADRVAPPSADSETERLTESVIDVASDPLVEREAATLVDPLNERHAGRPKTTDEVIEESFAPESFGESQERETEEPRYAARPAPLSRELSEAEALEREPARRNEGFRRHFRLSPAGERVLARVIRVLRVIGRVLAPIFLVLFGMVRGIANYMTERNEGRLDLRRASVWALIFLTSLFAADLLILNLRSRLLPEAVPVSRAFFKRQPRVTPPSDLAAIVNRNIFNSDGFIPDPAYATDEINEENAAPSNLQLTLLATIVYYDPRDSLAALKKVDEQFPKAYRKGDVIDGMGTVVKVTRGKVFLRNVHTNRLEFVEMKQEGPMLFGEFAAAGGGAISRRGETEFNVQRAEIQKQTANLPQLLQQARAVPNLGPGGRVDGFKIMMIQPGSVFEQLGIKMGDVIKSVNGQPLDSPARAMELYNNLREAPSVAIGVERDGRMQTFSYSMN